MQARNRSRSKSIATGTVHFPGSSGPIVGGPGSLVVYEQEMSDYIGKKRRLYDPTGYGLPPSPMSTTKIWRKPVLLNGSESSNPSTSGFFFKNYVWAAAATQPGPHATFPPGKDKGDNAYVLQLLARTNPMGAEFSVPVALVELVEITSLFRLVTKSFATFAGSGYLNFKFGWYQLWQDWKLLGKIFSIAMSRFEALRRMRERGGVRRRIKLDSFGVANSSPNFIIQSSWSVSLRSDARYATRRTVWGSVRWIPRGGNITLLPKEPSQQMLLAFQQVLDLETPDPSTLWNMVPWTWLIDYFTSMGDYLAAYEGRAIVEPTDICLMRETDTKVIFTRRKMNNDEDRISGGAGNFRRLTQERVLPTPPSVPPTFTNILSVSEMSVIVALLLKWRG